MTYSCLRREIKGSRSLFGGIGNLAWEVRGDFIHSGGLRRHASVAFFIQLSRRIAVSGHLNVDDFSQGENFF